MTQTPSDARVRPDLTDELSALMRARILVLDGAMGTMLQRHGLTEEDYRGERFRDSDQDLQGQLGPAVADPPRRHPLRAP